MSVITIFKTIKQMSTYELANLLSINYRSLIELCKNPKYKEFKISKKKGGFRKIQSPAYDLKKLQQTIAGALSEYYATIIPNEVHGAKTHVDNPVSNIITNATPHLNKRYLMNIDLNEFYPSIKSSRVYEMFKSNNFLDETASCLTLLTTYQKKLPTGSSCSPVIANLICVDLDNKICSFCDTHQITYTRYVDDLTFSSDSKFSKNNIESIKSIIEQFGFTINDSKFRVSGPNGAKYVTGIKVNEKLNIDRKYIRNIRAILNDCDKNGFEYAAKTYGENKGFIIRDIEHFSNILIGKIRFIGQVRGKNDAIYFKLLTNYKSIFNQFVKSRFPSTYK